MAEKCADATVLCATRAMMSSEDADKSSFYAESSIRPRERWGGEWSCLFSLCPTVEYSTSTWCQAFASTPTPSGGETFGGISRSCLSMALGIHLKNKIIVYIVTY
jgi:hypothetical protein